MIVNAWGVALSRRGIREADRLVTIYTENLGKLSARFVGVDKPGRKLKALSEPMIWAEYRLYLSPRLDTAKAIGGQIIASFPAIRSDFRRTVAGLSCCEMLARLTPERSPNEDKYRLICAALGALDAGASPWLETAYGLQLLELSGYGLRDVRLAATADAAERRIWEELHETGLGALGDIPPRPETERKFRQVVLRHVEAHIGKPLKSREFVEELRDAPPGRPALESVC